MFTFGDFKHELDYILKGNFMKDIFSPNLLINKGIESNFITPAIEKNVIKKGWNDIYLPENIKPTLKYVGIQNYENCCFLNASLQVLLNNTDFISSLYTYELRASGSSPVTEIILQYKSQMTPYEIDFVSNNTGDSITYYGNRLPTIGPCLHLVSMLGFANNQHQDAEEFITKLLTQIHEDLLTCVFNLPSSTSDQGSADDDWVEIGRGGKNMCPGREDGGDMSMETVLSQFLSGKITEKVTKRGVSKNATVTPFFILPLNIQSPDIIDVESAMRSLTRTEKLQDWSERQMQLSQLPTMLIIQMKRFTYTKNVGTEKITKHIKVNDLLTVPSECLHPTIRDSSSNCCYRLYAIIFHIGHGVLKGHYTSAIRDTSSWMYLDDTMLMQVQGPKSTHWLMDTHDANVPPELLALDIRTSAPQRSCVSGPRTPYLLFYTRVV